MKKIILMLVAMFTLSSMGFAQKAKKVKKRETVEFVVQDERLCNNCVRKVSDYMPFEKGVTGLDFNQKENIVKVTYRTDKTDVEKLQTAFKKIKMNVKPRVKSVEKEKTEKEE